MVEIEDEFLQELELSPRSIGDEKYPGKGMAAHMLEKYGGLSRRDCAPLIGITSGGGVAYQIRKMVEQAKTDPTLSGLFAKVEALLEKESTKQLILYSWD